ncbi:MAG: glycoside hydrolase family 43 protein [Janthinobacterium lividum]
MQYIRVAALGLALSLGLEGCQKNVSTGSATTPTPAPPTASTTFSNPLLTSGPDPWVYQKDGFYYYLSTTGGDVRIRKTAKMSELSASPAVVAWRPTNANSSHDVWAPELHFLDGKWYIYFTAGPGSCCGGQRLWVLENASADPTQGTWAEKGRIYNPTEDKWAIDGTVFEQGGKRYMLWSGHSTDTNDTQRIYISEMSNPWTLTGPRVELSSPQYTWEKSGPLPVNEGPEILQHDGKTFLIYSASHCFTDDYALGMLSMSSSGNPLDASAWTKSATPVFSTSAASGAYGPGHNGFFKSKDGSEDWLLYHANSLVGQGCGDNRNPRIQKFSWNADGTPNFGTPAAINVPLPRPAGE